MSNWHTRINLAYRLVMLSVMRDNTAMKFYTGLNIMLVLLCPALPIDSVVFNYSVSSG